MKRIKAGLVLLLVLLAPALVWATEGKPAKLSYSSYIGVRATIQNLSGGALKFSVIRPDGTTRPIKPQRTVHLSQTMSEYDFGLEPGSRVKVTNEKSSVPVIFWATKDNDRCTGGTFHQNPQKTLAENESRAIKGLRTAASEAMLHAGQRQDLAYRLKRNPSGSAVVKSISDVKAYKTYGQLSSEFNRLRVDVQLGRVTSSAATKAVEAYWQAESSRTIKTSGQESAVTYYIGGGDLHY